MLKENKIEVIGWESPRAIHPGEFLAEVLEEFNLSQVELSERINISPKVVNEIVKGKNPITRETAFKLSKIFPMSTDYWVNLQQSYENDIARIGETKKLAKEAEEYLPKFQETYKELAGLGLSHGISGLRWMKQNFDQITLELQKFFAADSLSYVEENMKQFARERGIAFPYLLDETQKIAKSYGAVCTPDPFLFDGEQKLVFHGRINNAFNPEDSATEHTMDENIQKILNGEKISDEFKPSMGCSIKWKTGH